MMTGFYILASLVAWQSLVALLDGVRYWRFVSLCLSRPPANYTPKVAVLAPCKGVDPGFRAQVRSLLCQDYPDYEVIFVTESQDDAAYQELSGRVGEWESGRKGEREKGRRGEREKGGKGEREKGGKGEREKGSESENVSHSPTRPFPHSYLVVAGPAQGRGQKVHNLLRALDHVSDDVEVLATLDSDATPSSSWLRYLVAPLQDREVGATTGYRWYIPAHGNGWSLLRSLWNANIVTALGPHKRNFTWGGSTAIRRETFAAAGVPRAWSGACTEDYPLSQAVKDHGLYVQFVPQCLIPSHGGCDLRELLRFTTRQMILTRVYAPRLWWLALISNVMFFGAFYGGLGILLLDVGCWMLDVGFVSDFGNSFLSIRNSQFAIRNVLMLVGLIYGLGVAKAVLRQKAVELILSVASSPLSVVKDQDQERPTPGHGQSRTLGTTDVFELKRYRLQYYFLYPLANLVYMYNLVVSAVSRKIHWRGIRYKLVSPTETLILGRD